MKESALKMWTGEYREKKLLESLRPRCEKTIEWKLNKQESMKEIGWVLKG